MADALGSAHMGASVIDNVPAEQRIYDRDKKLVRITHGRPLFSKIMMENFKSTTITARDPEPKWKSDIDRDIMFQLSTASDDYGGTENRIYVADAIAARISVNDMILVHEIFYNGSNYTLNRASDNNQREMLFVLQKGTSDGTQTWFKVQRGYAPAPGGSGDTPLNIPTTYHLTLLPGTVPEGLDEAPSYGDTPIEETNYCQIFLEKWAVTETVSNTVIYQDEGILSRNGRKALDLFFKKLEWAFQNGRKATGLQGGRRWWTTGGFIEYVLQANTPLGYAAAQNVEDFQTLYGNMGPQAFNDFCENKFYYGNGEMKFLIMGARAYTKYCNSFDPKVRLQNVPLSTKYGINITDHMGSNGGALHIVKSDDLSINLHGSEGFIVDFSHFQYMHLQNMDLQILTDVETNPHETVNEIYGQLGVHRTNPFAHWIVWNF